MRKVPAVRPSTIHKVFEIFGDEIVVALIRMMIHGGSEMVKVVLVLVRDKFVT